MGKLNLALEEREADPSLEEEPQRKEKSPRIPMVVGPSDLLGPTTCTVTLSRQYLTLD
jgi:hypothetical protein